MRSLALKAGEGARVPRGKMRARAPAFPAGWRVNARHRQNQCWPQRLDVAGTRLAYV
jgi:hypothetical protein